MAWLTGWNYRKKITISGSSGAGTNYQVLLKVGESSGASGYDFHLEGHSSSFPPGKNDGGDLRFTSDNGTTLLDFYVAKVSGSSPNRVAYIYVEVADDLGSNRDIYCYYGNSGASNYSNGYNTFVLFDDFEGSSLDTNKWETYGGLSYSVANSIITFTESSQADAGISTSGKVTINGQPLVAEIRMKKVSSVYTCFSKFHDTNGVNGIYDGENSYDSPYGHYFGKFGTNFGSDRGFAGSVTNDWREYKIIINGTAVSAQRGTDIFGTLGDSINITLNTSFNNYNYYFYLAGWNYPTDNQYDWVRIRKYVSTEPSFYSAGSEELPIKNTGNFFLFF